MPPKLGSLLHECWSQRPVSRPTFPTILKRINKAKPSKKSVLDCMMEAVEQYVGDLEEKVSFRFICLASPPCTRFHKILHFNSDFTGHLCSTREGNVFTVVWDSVQGERGNGVHPVQVLSQRSCQGPVWGRAGEGRGGRGVGYPNQGTLLPFLSFPLPFPLPQLGLVVLLNFVYAWKC